MRKTKLIAILNLFLIFLVSPIQSDYGFGSYPVSSQTKYIEPSLEVWYFIQSGSRTSEAFALYLKQAYAPLGIDLKIITKPFGQFVGDLLHFTTGRPFDLTQYRFDQSSPIPSFKWAYHSNQTSFGKSVYQLDNPDWQAWQERDTGVKTKDVDTLLESIEIELNLTRRMKLTDEFAELYMDKLLYDFPLVTPEFQVAMWAGFGGFNNELWDPQEGFLSSIAKGAGWINNPSERTGNDTTLRLSQLNPNSYTFDPMQIFDPATKAMLEPMVAGLLLFDSEFKPRPGIAYSFINNDLVNYDIGNGTLQNVPYGNFTYYIRDDAMWPTTTNSTGGEIAAHPVDAQDFWFTYEIYQLNNVIVYGQEAFQSVLGAELSSTEYVNDTLKIYIDNGTYRPVAITPNDYYTFGKINPMPYHILGGNLTFTNSSGTWTGDMYELDALGINVQNTEEWKYWASQEGHSLVGPYELVDMVEGEFRSYQFRTDWFYPNEWDSAAHPNVEGGIFAPHQNTVNPAPVDWAYVPGANTVNPIKPSAPKIESIFHIIIEDTNARLLAFEDGEIDYFTSSTLGAQLVADHQNSSPFVVKQITPLQSPELLIFNLLHPDLKKFNVRKAMAAAIDLNQIIQIYDGFAQPHYSPVWAFQTEWYRPYPVESSYEMARDLMRSEGYPVLDSILENACDFRCEEDRVSIPIQPQILTIEPAEKTEVITNEVIVYKTYLPGFEGVSPSIGTVAERITIKFVLISTLTWFGFANSPTIRKLMIRLIAKMWIETSYLLAMGIYTITEISSLIRFYGSPIAKKAKLNQLVEKIRGTIQEEIDYLLNKD